MEDRVSNGWPQHPTLGSHKRALGRIGSNGWKRVALAQAGCHMHSAELAINGGERSYPGVAGVSDGQVGA